MGRFIQKLIILIRSSIIFVIFSSALFANIPISSNLFPGGIAVIEFETSHSDPKAYYGKVRLYVQQIKDNHWQALVGIPLLSKPGIKEIVIKTDSVDSAQFKVEYYPYDVQHITLSGDKKKYIDPGPTNKYRINNERNILTKTRRFYSDTELSVGYFIMPVDSTITSKFGNKRFYNGKESLPHTGLDLSGSTGSPIKASADGIVLLVDNFFYNGNSIFINHGQGLISAYMHMDEISVKYGQKIEQGDVIGTIGQSGRATGPHLHWSVYLNGTVVNPKLLLKK